MQLGLFCVQRVWPPELFLSCFSAPCEPSQTRKFFATVTPRFSNFIANLSRLLAWPSQALTQVFWACAHPNLCFILFWSSYVNETGWGPILSCAGKLDADYALSQARFRFRGFQYSLWFARVLTASVSAAPSAPDTQMGLKWSMTSRD